MYRIYVFVCVMSCVIAVRPIHHEHTLKRPRTDNRISRSAYVQNSYSDSKIYGFDNSGDQFSFDTPVANEMWPMYGDGSSFGGMTSLTPTPLSPSYRMMEQEAKFNSNMSPEAARVKSDIMYEKLKANMHYTPPEGANDHFSGYENTHDYHNDDDDVRSSGMPMYGNYWPYFYHSPYEYEHNKNTYDIQKAKDKRYALHDSSSEQVKPVHEYLDNDVPVPTPNYPSVTPATSVTPTTPDNPIGGNGPFFTFVLNDYFDKSVEEDPLLFKGIGDVWSKDFNQNTPNNTNESLTRNRRLEESYNSQEFHEVPTAPIITPTYYTAAFYTTTPSYLTSIGRSVATPYRANQVFDAHETGRNRHLNEKGDNSYSNNKADKAASEHKYEGFKDFLDTFANKFGSENHKKDSSYMLLNDKDKGEKKKGFRRVYHKDEFLEDNEFYDNSVNKLKSEEKGASNANIGGSEAYLRSKAIGGLRNAVEASNELNNRGHNKYDNAYRGDDVSGTLDSFIDVAKRAANSNRISPDY